MNGDVEITADRKFVGEGGDRRRKACLMIRQSLEPDSAYVDAALHGDGLTSLQFRDAKGAATQEVQSRVLGPTRVRFVRRGKSATLHVARDGESLASLAAF